MATTGYTTTGAVADSLPDMRMSARNVREQGNVMTRLVSRETLGKGMGLTWNEVSYSKLTAQNITETTKLDNPQQIEDTLLTVTPSQVGIHYVITDKTRHRIFSKGLAKMAALGQASMERKKDEDGLTAIDGATTSLCGTGTTLASGHVFAALNRIQGNTTEPGNPPFYVVLHPYGVKDLQDELVAGVGTYAVPQGLTSETYRQGFSGTIGGAEIYADGNITIDSTPDAKGGVFAKEALILVQGMSPRMTTVRDESLGGGSDVIYHYDDYAYGERGGGVWLFELLHDATAPSS